VGIFRAWAQDRRLRTPTTTLGLAMLAALVLAGSALAAAPGRPTAKTPNAISTVITTTPTFKWSRAARTATYEVRVYKGSALQVKKTGIGGLSWKSSKVLTKGVTYTWKVRGRKAGVNGAWSRSLKFTVASSDKAITAFGFQGLAPPVVGAITEADHAITATVPFGTDVSGLVATFTTSGATIKVVSALQTSGTTPNDFTSPVTYTATAADTSTQAYVVTVTVAANPAKAITAFSVQGLAPPVTGTVTEADHTIAVTVPFGTDVSALVATFTTSGAAVKVGGALQTSGTTANNFRSPVTYIVTAADVSTQDYVVTVTIAAPVIGQSYGGGVVAYILQDGDPGYVAGQQHGLIAATADQSASIPWWNGSYTDTGATAMALGTGSANTTAIIASQGETASTYAAGLARAYNGGGYSDWYLPSMDELYMVILNKASIGGFDTNAYGEYWCSSEAAGFYAEIAYFWYAGGGYMKGALKNYTAGVRAVRTF